MKMGRRKIKSVINKKERKVEEKGRVEEKWKRTIEKGKIGERKRK